MKDENIGLRKRAIEFLRQIDGFRGLEVDGNDLVVYVVSRSDEAKLPASFEHLQVSAVVAEKLRKATPTAAGSGFAVKLNAQRRRDAG
jgi:hypothetical protein